MTDDRVCCENIAGGNVCNCERDEGRPLVTVLQEMVANQCMLLCLRDKVVSDTPKGDVNRQVTVQEMTARELLMKHRKLFRRCQNRVFSVRPGINPEGTCLRSGWHPVQDSMTCTEAFSRNAGTCSGMLREKFKQKPCKNQRTEDRRQGRTVP